MSIKIKAELSPLVAGPCSCVAPHLAWRWQCWCPFWFWDCAVTLCPCHSCGTPDGGTFIYIYLPYVCIPLFSWLNNISSFYYQLYPTYPIDPQAAHESYAAHATCSIPCIPCTLCLIFTPHTPCTPCIMFIPCIPCNPVYPMQRVHPTQPHPMVTESSTRICRSSASRVCPAASRRCL